MPRTKSRPQTVASPLVATNRPAAEVFTLAEAAAYLRLPEQDVVRKVREQGLPARQVGLEWRFFKAAIQHWLSTGSPKPSSSKENLLAWAGAFKDDPDLDAIVDEALRQRGRQGEVAKKPLA
jgi:excisionase family DNA binding protein